MRVLILFAVLLLGACGQSGELYLPDDAHSTSPPQNTETDGSF